MILVIDTSAIVAILEDEPERAIFSRVMAAASCRISAGSVVEALRVVGMRRAGGATREVWALIAAQQIEVASFDLEQARLADDGHARFGKGRREAPAVLNLGDLFAYALARQLDAPLLFKGDDFRQTDVRPALPA